ncbi:MAG: tetratricopeptide repeat protein, partial [Dehalococcoidia bacterium]
MKTAIPHLALFLLSTMLMACVEDEPATSSFRKGNEYADQGEFEKAIAEFTEAVRLDARHFDAYLNMGVAYGNLR